MRSVRKDHEAYLRNFVFGVEDSLVSTVGLLSGIAVAGVEVKTIVLTGLVLVVVEALSMAVGSYLSEYSVEEYDHESSQLRVISAAAVMFFSYLIAGFVPLAPYALGLQNAFQCSIIASLVALFALGIVSARVTNSRPLPRGLRMLAGGGAAIAAGVLIGGLFR